MKQLAEYIFHDIDRNLKDSEKQVVRVDGFEDLGVYLHLCQRVEKLCLEQGRTLVAKLSRKKFEQFKKKGQWSIELTLMQEKGWVDEEDHMTSYRNMLPVNGKKLLVLLLGTDMVDDKGGLNDFFAITPNRIDIEIGNTYSNLIGSELRDIFENEQINDVVNCFFTDLFSCVPKNLSQVSAVFDEWERETPTVKEAMIDLFRRLPTWGIPRVQDAAENLTPSKFISVKGKNSLLIKANGFIQGKTYSRVTKKIIENIEKKFAQYQGAEGRQPGKYAMEYPEGQALTSIADLQKAAVSFVMGDRNEELRDKLIHTDYSILNDILNLNINGPKKTKETATKIKGMPLEVILQAFLSVLYENNQGVDCVRIRWRKAQMCGIPSNVEVADADEKDALLQEAWDNIARFAGGIGVYIEQENWQGAEGEPVTLCMEPLDFFSPKAENSLIQNGTVSAGTGSMHKISFIVEALCGETIIGDEEYCWEIEPNEDWMLAFRDFSKMPEEETSYLPFIVLPEINSAYTLKDEDSFAYWITHAKINVLTGKDSVWNMLGRSLQGSEDEQSKFYKLGKSFQKFRNQVINEGFYTSVNDTANIFLSEYISLANHISKDVKYVGKLNSIAGKMTFFFTMCGNDDPIRGRCSASQVIVPPWHPATLEKISDQMLFIRSGMHEWNLSQKTSSKELREQMEALKSLSSIHNSTDAFFGVGNELLTHGTSFGYYTLYGSVCDGGLFTRAQQIERREAVFEDDFDDKEMKNMTREAQVLLSVMNQYVETYPQAKKTISISFINPEDLQIVVSALYKYVSDLRKECPNISTSIRINVIMPDNMPGARTYLAYWINHVFTLDDALDIKAYLRVYRDEKEIPKLIPDTTDISFFFNAMTTRQNTGYHFYRSTATEKMSDCRFPMVFKPALKAKYSTQHSIDITQPQFRAATAYVQMMRVYNDKQVCEYPYVLVQTSEADEKRGKIIGNVQKKVVWLCCMDNAMDKYSIRKLYAQDTGIIGFTTGEGSYGQMNMALTCRADIMEDMRSRCVRRLHKMFPSWTAEQLADVAAFCLKKAGKLDGVSILRAMNPNDYDMNNFLAYLIANELNEKSSNRLSILIRLDSYRHWFADQKEKKIPDFLLIESDVAEGKPFHIEATVIEAKIASGISMITEHIPKAMDQVTGGLETLKKHFDPDSQSVERRYWLAQLYRAIAFLQADIDFDEMTFQTLTEKLNEMIEGQFTIHWNGRILGCEIDSDSTLEKSVQSSGETSVEYWQIGQLAMQNVLMGRAIDEKVKFDGNATSEMDEIVNDVSEGDADDIEEFDESRTEPLRINPEFDVSKQCEELHKEKEFEGEQTEETQQNDYSHKGNGSPVSEQVGVKAITDAENEKKKLEEIRVLIGEDRLKHPVCWEFGHKQLANRHLLITGGSGQGKTYAIQTFLYELARQNISSVVFDYTDGFLPGKLEPPFEEALQGKIVQHYAITGHLPINPFKRQALNIPGLPEGMLEHTTNVASRFSAIMKHVYSFGEQQASALYQACKEGIDHFGEQMDFEKLRQLLRAQQSSYSKTVLSKMQQLFDLNLFDTKNAFDWSKITERDGKVTIIQLTNLDREVQTVITEMLMWDAWYSLVKNGDKTRPFVVVLDEAQNLSISDGSPAQKILQEGRKYGWSAWFATQFMKGALSSDEISRLQQAAETLYFKPSAEETSSVSSMLSDGNMSVSEWNEILKNMQKGQCIVKGDRVLSNQRFGAAPATLVRVSSFEERN